MASETKQEFTDLEKLAALERELRMRRRVYPRWVSIGKMRAEDATRELMIMEAIAIDYRGKTNATGK